MLKLFRAEVELESYSTQAIANLKFHCYASKAVHKIRMKIDSGAAMTLMRDFTIQSLGVESEVIGEEFPAQAANGTKFIIQQVRLMGALEIGKVVIENPIIHVTKPQIGSERERDNMRNNLLGFDLISCCANFTITMPPSYKSMMCKFLFRNDRLSKYCSKIKAPSNWVDEVEICDASLALKE